jgi:hypothetical protein
MANNILTVRWKQRNRLIRSLVINLAAIGLAVYLLMPAGPIFSSTRVDLSFLLLPITGYFVLRLASAFCLIYINSRAGYTAVCILRGTATAFFLFWLFDKAILLTRISILSGLQKFLSGLSEIDVYAVLFVFGATLARVCGLYKMQTREKYLGPLGISLGQLIMGFSLWRAVGYYGLYWKPSEGIGLVLMIGMSALALSTLGLLGDKTRYSLIADLCAWLRASPAGKFLGGAALAAYLIFLRPRLFKYVPYAFLIEWTLLCLIIWQIYRDIHNILRARHTAVPIETDWQKHVQQIDDLIDEDFSKIGLLQRDFVELGNRRDLLNYLKQVLLNNKLTDDQINEDLRDLIEYSDKKIRWYVIWIWRKRRVQNNLQNRKQALQNTIRNLTAIAHPVYTKNRSNI